MKECTIRERRRKRKEARFKMARANHVIEEEKKEEDDEDGIHFGGGDQRVGDQRVDDQRVGD